MCEDKIEKIEDVFQLIRTNCSDAEHQRFYRGVNFVHEIERDLPKIARTGYGSLRERESEIIHEALIYRPDYFKTCKSAISILELMQHYGFPTRLLDITENPLVALYFACSGNDNGDGQLILYDINKCNIKYDDSDTVSILANQAFMPKDFDLKFLVNDDQPADKKYKNYKKLIHQIRCEKSYFKDEIDTNHLKGYVVCVKTRYNNQRIAAQEGAFLLFGDNYIITKLEALVGICGRTFSNLNSQINQKMITWKRLIIPAICKKGILKDLDEVCCINEPKLFPELEFFAKKYRQ